MAHRGMIIGAVMGTLTLAGLASGQSMESTKQAPLTSVIPGLHSSTELYQKAKFDKEGDSLVSVGEAHYIIGSKFYGDRMDAKFNLGVEQSNKEGKAKLMRTEFDVTFDVYKNDYVLIQPLVETDLPHEEKKYDANPGLYVEGSYPVTSGIGVFKFVTSAKGTANLVTYDKTREPKEVDEDKAEGLGLTTPEDQEEVAREGNDYFTEYTAAIKYNPIAALQFQVKGYIFRSFDSNTVIEDEALNPSNTSTGRVGVSYEFANGLTVANDTYTNFDGVYEAASTNEDVPPIVNELSLTKTLL